MAEPRVPGAMPMDRITDFLTCPLCHGLFREPVALAECLHAFCRSCALRFFHASEFDCCPVCSVSLGPFPVHQLRTDHVRQAVIEKVFTELEAAENEAKSLYNRRWFTLHGVPHSVEASGSPTQDRSMKRKMTAADASSSPAAKVVARSVMRSPAPIRTLPVPSPAPVQSRTAVAAPAAAGAAVSPGAVHSVKRSGPVASASAVGGQMEQSAAYGRGQPSSAPSKSSHSGQKPQFCLRLLPERTQAVPFVLRLDRCSLSASPKVKMVDLRRYLANKFGLSSWLKVDVFYQGNRLGDDECLCTVFQPMSKREKAMVLTFGLQELPTNPPFSTRAMTQQEFSW